jgi:nitroreductase
MLKASEIRRAEHPVHTVFLDRWSPRAMSGAAIPEADLSTLLEAARWAPSSYNAQPWRILYALRDDESWPRFLDLLDEANRDWAQDAGALLVFVSRTAFERNGRPSLTHSFDAGAAWENLALQGTLLGWAVHGMEGFDYDRARADLAIPDLYQVEMMAAVGRARDPEELGDAARRQERPSGRKPLAAIAFRGTFPSGLS